MKVYLQDMFHNNRHTIFTHRNTKIIHFLPKWDASVIQGYSLPNNSQSKPTPQILYSKILTKVWLQLYFNFETNFTFRVIIFTTHRQADD